MPRDPSQFLSGMCLILVLAAAINSRGADDAWVKALIESSKDGLTIEARERHFLDAVDAAAAPAPILVSLGDFLAGATLFYEGIKDAPETAPAGKVREVVRAEVARLLAKMDVGHSKALGYYQRAVEADPDIAVGWFRIVTFEEADPELKQAGVRNLVRLLPESSLPHYLDALPHQEAGELGRALAAVVRGSRLRFVAPSTSVPDNHPVLVTVNDEERNPERSGQPVPAFYLRGISRSS